MDCWIRTRGDVGMGFNTAETKLDRIERGMSFLMLSSYICSIRIVRNYLYKESNIVCTTPFLLLSPV